MNDKKIIDISLTLHNSMITYPGNEPFNLQEKPRTATRLSTMNLGTHTGTHIDAPVHTEEHLFGADALDLNKCVGTCRVLDLGTCDDRITVSDLEKYHVQRGERILLKTSNSARGFNTFYDDYVALSGDAADWLVAQGIILCGIDSLSIKKRGEDDVRAHTSLLRNEIVIVEGLDLHDVQEGTYELIVLPLKILNGDGAPSRAILIEK